MFTSHLSGLCQFSDPCSPSCKLQLRNQTVFPAVDAFAVTLDAPVATGVAQIPNSLWQHVAVVCGKVAIAGKCEEILTFATPESRRPSPVPNCALSYASYISRSSFYCGRRVLRGVIYLGAEAG